MTDDNDVLVTNQMLWLLQASLREAKGYTREEARENAARELDFCTVCKASDSYPLCDHCVGILQDISVSDN
jgi:hypothetical protein